METEDIIKLPASSGADSGSDIGACDLNHEFAETEVEGDWPVAQSLGHCEEDTDVEEGQLIPAGDTTEDAVANSSVLHESKNFTETCTEMEVLNDVNVPAEIGCVKEDESLNSLLKTDGSFISGVKRAGTMCDEHQASVYVNYNHLPRDSKRKLEELLRQWSEWHARYCSSLPDLGKVLESGEETYFPALHFGVEKASSVTFWMDNQTRKPADTDFMPADDGSVPLYDRGYALGLMSPNVLSNIEGGLDIPDAPRCFNCGSYSHSLKECPKPRDNNAVNNARKQRKSRRNQTAGSRNPMRYYQNSPAGKYEGLKPGVLEAETRKLLGLGELDPPPWLNRMREIGYPPGYLEPEEGDQPSGITIYGDEEEVTQETEDGEILEAMQTEPLRRMTVKFPGINAPIPPNADGWLWAAKPFTSDRYRNEDNGRSNHSSESYNKGYYQERNIRDLKDQRASSSERRHSPPRYGDYDSKHASQSSRGTGHVARSPSYDRSESRYAREDSPTDGLYNSFSYSSPSRHFSELKNGFGRHRDDFTSGYLSRSREDGRHRHRSGR